MSSVFGGDPAGPKCSLDPTSEHGPNDISAQLELKLFPEIQIVSIDGDKQHDSHDAIEIEIDPLAIEAARVADQSVGTRLRCARESRGWTREDISARLKLQSGLVRRIEEDDYSGIAHAVYLRGYLTSYARLLGLPLSIADEVVTSRAEETPLVSTGTISRSRYLLDRYSVSATYLILTGLVIGPAVWLATHGGLRQDLARTVLLDAPGAQVNGQTGSSTSYSDVVAASSTGTAISLPPPVVNADPSPVVASMAPFSSMQSSSAASITTVEPVTGNRHSLTLKLEQASWVEVTSAADGKLEYSLLAAGSERTYASDGEITLRIGNAEGAVIIADGKPVDLAPFRRANVAHLKIFGNGNGDGARHVEF